MLSPGLILLHERLDSLVNRRRAPPEVQSRSDRLALARHYRDYLESDPSLRQSRFDGTQAPETRLDYYASLRDQLEQAGVPVVDAPIRLSAFRAWLRRFAVLDRFYRRFNDIWIEKCLEHYLVDRELGLGPNDIYVDVASAGSPWARVLRHCGVEAYRLDLIYREGRNGINIGGDAVRTGLSDGSVRSVSIQCAFELFYGDTDRVFIDEVARILHPGGLGAVTPLYLDDAHFVLHSPRSLPPQGSEEPGAVRVWRDDGVRAPYSRHYSPEAFVARIASRLPADLGCRVVYTPNLGEVMAAYPGQRIYNFFTLVLERSGGPGST